MGVESTATNFEDLVSDNTRDTMGDDIYQEMGRYYKINPELVRYGLENFPMRDNVDCSNLKVLTSIAITLGSYEEAIERIHQTRSRHLEF